LGILLSLNYAALAEDKICFSPDTAGNMVVELERGRAKDSAYQLMEEGNGELQKQLKIYESMLAEEKQKTGVYETTIKSYDSALTAQREICDRALKDAKPSLVKQLINNLGFIGLGALLMLLL
jgi:hypothetical protein